LSAPAREIGGVLDLMMPIMDGADCIRAKDAHPELSHVPRGRLLGSLRCIAGRGLVIVERPALRRIGEHRQPRGELVAGAVAARMRHA
jgi:hypothetical protein